jgi:geranylgeranyl pyrophosphate synthase
MNTKKLAESLGVPEFQQFLNQVDTVLYDSVRAYAPNLKKPVLQVIKSGGKRLRPTLVVAAALINGKKVSNKTIKAAAAIELIHLASLVHDDIIDESAMRHGQPTIHSQSGVDTAIVAGDYILALAAKLAAQAGSEVAVTLASAFAAVCDGQALEMTDEYNLERSIESYLETIRKKTAALLSAACRIGGICAGLPEDQINALKEFGENFGMSYQIIDDVLDFLAHPQNTGKPVGRDVAQGVYTMPLLLALQDPKSQQIKPLLKQKPLESEAFLEITNFLHSYGSFEQSLDEVKRYNLKAAQSLEVFSTNSVIKGLGKLPSIYLDLALQKRNR